jgi:hypothetical protein
MDWSVLLFLLKWILLGLVYLVLILVLVGVTREMRMRLPAAAPASPGVSVGRLRVIQAGSDPSRRPGLVMPLQPDTVLGAQNGSTIVLQDRYISGRHARLHWDGVSWWVEDLNSTNGTYVNRQRVAPGVTTPLPAGSVLEIGDMAFEMLE